MIKYHDNNGEKAYEVDENLHYANNWNPDLDYGDEYVNVHFRINCPTFSCYNGFFENKEDGEAFAIDKGNVFSSIGWKEKCPDHNGHCMEVKKGKSELYLHPQDFSGVVRKDEVKEIAEVLESNKTFSLEWVDIYQTVYNMTDKEYDSYLETKRETARILVFERCRTTRTYNFKHLFDVCDYVGGKIMLPRVGHEDIYHCSGKDLSFVSEVINDLEAEGYLQFAKTANGTKIVRSLNRTELKAKKLKTLA